MLSKGGVISSWEKDVQKLGIVSDSMAYDRPALMWSSFGNRT